MSEEVKNVENQPKKPGPIDITKLVVPGETPSQPKERRMANPAEFPNKVEIKFTNNESIVFDINSPEQASKFIDSVYAIFETKVSVARIGVGGELYLIPRERFLYAKLVRG